MTPLYEEGPEHKPLEVLSEEEKMFLTWPFSWPYWWIYIDIRVPYSSPDEKGVVIYVDFKRRRKV